MSKNKKISLIEAIAMAVGTMIGASIFSIFGLGVKIAGKNLPEAFILSGLLALIVAYSYAKLGSKIVSNAGPIAFILKGIGDNIATGTLSILMWLTYVISISLFAKGFAGYFLPLTGIGVSPWAMALTEAGIILFFTALNFFGSKSVGRAEFYIVMVKLSILLLFIILGMMTITTGGITPSYAGSHLESTLNAAVVFFLSYMGFGLITNASENMTDPRKNVPRAIYLSIFVVMVIYVLVAVVTLGNLSVQDIIKAQENALAEAAKPFLGQAGYILISLGALFSISSALNATLFGGANIAYSLAKKGELPDAFERKVWFDSTEGLYFTAGLGLVMAIAFNVGEIASLTSTIFTVIYIFVIISHIRLIKETGGSRVLLYFNLAVLLAVFAALLTYQWNNQHPAFIASVIALGGAVALEAVYKAVVKREFSKTKEKL